MNFFFKLSFWGYLLLGLGILLFVDMFYPIKISFWVLFCAIVLISLGIQLLIMPKNVKSWHLGSDFKSVKTKFSYGKTEENIIFGKSILDYTTIKKTDEKQLMDISIIFAQGTLLINPQDPIQIKASCVFGNITLPDGQSVSFGERIFETESFAGSTNPIVIKMDVVFGEGIVQEKLP